MVTKDKVILIALISLVCFAFGCKQEEKPADQTEGTAAAKAAAKAVAEMSATTGNQAHGTVTFTKVDGGVRVVAHFEAVAEGAHGFHIHEKGDCSSGDGTSAGGHFNPAGVDHAGPTSETRHVGDLGNISADTSGIAHLDYVDKHLAFEGMNSVIGKGVILHADPDDLTSQPTGAAGARLACGVIELSK